MKFTEEDIRKAMSCKTADELIALAKSWGIEMTREQAEEYLAKMNTMELTEEELAQVAGGSCPEQCPEHCWQACFDRGYCHKFYCPPYQGSSCPAFCPSEICSDYR